jgi:hypothetical protein
MIWLAIGAKASNTAPVSAGGLGLSHHSALGRSLISSERTTDAARAALAGAEAQLDVLGAELGAVAGASAVGRDPGLHVVVGLVFDQRQHQHPRRMMLHQLRDAVSGIEGLLFAVAEDHDVRHRGPGHGAAVFLLAIDGRPDRGEFAFDLDRVDVVVGGAVHGMRPIASEGRPEPGTRAGARHDRRHR